MNTKMIKNELVSLVSSFFDNFDNNIIDANLLDCIDLIDDLGLDSITFISIVIEIEKRFDISIPDDKLLMDNFKAIDKIATMIHEELSKKEVEI